MVDRYWRKIESVENDIENFIQISSILLKLKGYDEKLSDLSKIENNENNINNVISAQQTINSFVSTNISDITGNSSKMNTNKNDISSNLGKINDNENSISNNSSKINDDENSISNNLEKINNFTQYILKSSKDFAQTYTIEKQIFRFNKDTHFYTIFEKEIEYGFAKNSLLFVKNSMYYRYDN